MKQVVVLDSLRWLAALSVCLYHFVCTTTGFQFSQAVNSAFNFGQYGVYVFFVISGFIIPWSMHNNNYKLKFIFKFIAKRLIRLEPPYLISILLILIVTYAKSKFHLGAPSSDNVTFTRVALHFGYLINFFLEYNWLNNVYWTLAIEFQYYLAIALIYTLFINKSIAIRLAVYCFCFIIAYIIPDPNLEHFPAYAPLFLFGICAFQYKINVVTYYEFFMVTILCFVYNYFLIGKEFAYFGIFTSLIIIYFSELKIPLFNSLGKISYSLYLIHPIIGAAVINLLYKDASTSFLKMALVFLGLFVTVIASYIMYILIEKPSKNLSAKIKFKCA